MEITIDDPRAADVTALLGLHLAHMRSQSPPENVFALDVTGLADPAVTLYSCRQSGELLAIGALKDIGDRHGRSSPCTPRRQPVAAASAGPC